ncbi:hypothetical protein SLEP1_g41242 [Rubroshorea leprosula]|uniref:Uncharacterized protein n=1 Tax=Rubroshorea leprosula TaxID=152421 RepID=A0AAV5L6T2_9ROSI|nr:hypothetical protein SLEP1_g41242 [Rubroshorea leprosula]
MSSKLNEGILLSGCQADELFVDMSESEGEGKACGVFSNTMQMVLKENLGLLNNKEVVMMAKKVLQAQWFEQHPCLYYNNENIDATFL